MLYCLDIVVHDKRDVVDKILQLRLMEWQFHKMVI